MGTIFFTVFVVIASAYYIYCLYTSKNWRALNGFCLAVNIFTLLDILGQATK